MVARDGSVLNVRFCVVREAGTGMLTRQLEVQLGILKLIETFFDVV